MRVPGEVRQKPSPSASRPTTTGRQPFALVSLLPDGGPSLVALRQGQIEPADLAVVMALLQAFEWKAGRCWAEWADLAAATGMPEEAVRAAVERLIWAELLAVGRDADCPRWAFWVLHPHLASDGRTTPVAERRRWAQWAELVAAGARMDDRVSGVRLRKLRQRAREREQLEAAARAAEAGQVPAAPVAERELVLVGAGASPVAEPVLEEGCEPELVVAAPRRRRQRTGAPAGRRRKLQPEPAQQAAIRQQVLTAIEQAPKVNVRHTPEQEAEQEARRRQLDADRWKWRQARGLGPEPEPEAASGQVGIA